MGLLQIVTAVNRFVSCSGRGVNLLAEDNLHQEFWGLFGGCENARALREELTAVQFPFPL